MARRVKVGVIYVETLHKSEHHFRKNSPHRKCDTAAADTYMTEWRLGLKVGVFYVDNFHKPEHHSGFRCPPLGIPRASYSSSITTLPDEV